MVSAYSYQPPRLEGLMIRVRVETEGALLQVLLGRKALGSEARRIG